MPKRMQWEKFWYRDFFDDVACLSFMARGLWISCLCRMWSDGRSGELIGTTDEFCRMLGCSQEEFRKGISELETRKVADIIHSTSCRTNSDGFPEFSHPFHEEFRIISRRLKREKFIKEYDRLRKKKIKIPKNFHKNSDKIPPVEERRKKKEEYILRDSANPAVKIFIDFWFEKFQEKFKSPYVVTSKDGSLVKRLLRTFSLEELEVLALKFFDSQDEFIVKAGFSIGVFFTQINRLTSQKPKRNILYGQ